jgi:hypothetical protein
LFFEGNGEGGVNNGKYFRGKKGTTFSLLKRVRFLSGYKSNETAAHFTSEKIRQRIADEACFSKSEYVLALTEDYSETIKRVLDPNLGDYLHLKVFTVGQDGVKSFAW